MTTRTPSNARSRTGFAARTIHTRSHPHAFQYLKEKMTFWIAVLSIFAFVAGNMLGKLGWYGFWASVMGEFDDSLIVYDGAVPPVRRIPDYTRWSIYGGTPEVHTFREVPRDVLMDFPRYVPATQRSREDTLLNRLISVDHMGTYAHVLGGGEGAHPGLDFALPVGTPIVAIMRGVVVRAAEDHGGYGKYVTLRHYAPDPENPASLTQIYTVYGHLSAIQVEKGMVVQKGDQLGLSGQTGNASGPHLHVQMQRGVESFWPFTNADLREAGLSFAQAIDAGLKRDEAMKVVLNPMLYVQAQYPAVAGTLAQAASSASSRKRPPTRSERLAARLAKSRAPAPPVSVVQTQAIGLAAPTPPAAPPPASIPQAPVTGEVARIDLEHPRSFAALRDAFSLRIVLRDVEGNKVSKPRLDRDVYLTTAFGQATFQPSKLSELDFTDGEATVKVVPIARQTIIIQAQPFGKTSEPIQYIGPR